MWERYLNAIMAIILSAVLWGALSIQFFKHETPCPLCLMQRLGMLGVAAGALLNVKYGPQKKYYALSLLSAFYGGFVAIRQIALHICPGFPTFGLPFWGLSLYTWSFIVFVCSLVYIALLLLIFDWKKTISENKQPWLGHVAFVFLFLVSLVNIFATLWQCGIGPCADV